MFLDLILQCFRNLKKKKKVLFLEDYTLAPWSRDWRSDLGLVGSLTTQSPVAKSGAAPTATPWELNSLPLPFEIAAGESQESLVYLFWRSECGHCMSGSVWSWMYEVTVFCVLGTAQQLLLHAACHLDSEFTPGSSGHWHCWKGDSNVNWVGTILKLFYAVLLY